jgi:hypothetical protein
VSEFTGITIDPVTGQVMVTEGVALALAVAGWIAALVAGLLTSWLVLP